MTNVSASSVQELHRRRGEDEVDVGICNLSIAEARPLIREEEVEMGHNNDGDSKHL